MLTGLAQQVYPVNPHPAAAGSLDGDEPGTEGFEPITQGQQARGGRREGASLRQQQAAFGGAHTRQVRLLVNAHSGAARLAGAWHHSSVQGSPRRRDTWQPRHTADKGQDSRARWRERETRARRDAAGPLSATH